MEEMISEKNDRDEGSSSCSNSVDCQYHSGVWRRRELTFSVLIAECALTHVRQLDGTFRACVHKPITALRVELSSGDDFGQFLHVCRLDINNVEALVLDIEVPQIDA